MTNQEKNQQPTLIRHLDAQKMQNDNKRKENVKIRGANQMLAQIQLEVIFSKDQVWFHSDTNDDCLCLGMISQEEPFASCESHITEIWMI